MMTKEYKTTWIDVKIGENSGKIFKDGKIDIVVGTQVFDVKVAEDHGMKNSDIKAKKIEYKKEPEKEIIGKIIDITEEVEVPDDIIKLPETEDDTPTTFPVKEIDYVVEVPDDILGPIGNISEETPQEP